MSNHSKKIYNLLIKYLIIVVVCAVILTPILIVVFTSFKTDAEYVKSGVFTLPEKIWNIDNYITFCTKINIGRVLFNTAFIVGLAVLGNVIMGSMVAFVLNRFEFRLKKVIFLTYVFVSIVPSVITEITRFKIISTIGLYNTIWSGVILFMATDIIQIYIYLQFISKIPVSLDESAMLEGASYFKIYTSIILPMLGPATMTVIVIKGFMMYKEMYIPYLYMPHSSLKVASTALMAFSSDLTARWNVMSAGIVITLIPTLLLYVFLQKYIVEGALSGSVKA